MTDRISTEEAERIAESLDFDCKCHRCASSAQQIGADALRSLAAERDELNKALALKADDAYRAGYAAGYPEGFAAALWEEDR